MRVNARETYEAELVRSTVRIQTLKRRANMLAGRNHLSTRLASAIFLVIKRAVMLLWKAMKQAENGTYIIKNTHCIEISL